MGISRLPEMYSQSLKAQPKDFGNAFNITTIMGTLTRLIALMPI